MRILCTCFLTLWTFFFCLSERFVMHDEYPSSVSEKLSKKFRVGKKVSESSPPPPPPSAFLGLARLSMLAADRKNPMCPPPPPPPPISVSDLRHWAGMCILHTLTKGKHKTWHSMHFAYNPINFATFHSRHCPPTYPTHPAHAPVKQS